MTTPRAVGGFSETIDESRHRSARRGATVTTSRTSGNPRKIPQTNSGKNGYPRELPYSATHADSTSQTSNPRPTQTSIRPVVESANTATRAEPNGLGGERQGSLAGEPTRELGEDRQVGVEPDPIQSANAQGKQRPLVLEPAELPLDGTARAVEPSDSRGINGCSRENSGLIAASCVRRAMTTTTIVGLPVVVGGRLREGQVSTLT